MHRCRFTLVACIDANGGIGYKGHLPWKNQRDMANFKKITSKPNAINVVIMGRKTFQSLKRPLQNRVNFVISTRQLPDQPNVRVFQSPEECIKACSNPNDNYFVIGGASIYTYFLDQDLIKKIYLTTIVREYTCDTYFTMPASKFTIKDCQVWEPENSLFEIFERK
jgi:dihydrofolate reductase